MFSDRDEVCEASGEATAPEELYPVEVPYFGRSYRFNKRSADDFRCGGLKLRVPAAPPPSLLPPLEPLPDAEDARALALWASEELIEDGRRNAPLSLANKPAASPALDSEPAVILALHAGISAGTEIAPLEELERAVDRHEECAATWPLFALYALSRAELTGLEVPNGLEPYRRAAIESAGRAMGKVLKLPPRRPAAVTVVLLEAAVKILSGQSAGAKNALTGCIDFLERRRDLELVDPRLFLYLARVYQIEGNLGGVDRAQVRALDSATRHARFIAEARAGLARRATAREDWPRALEELRAYVRERPEDLRGHIDLAYAYLKRLRSDIAREVLEPALAREARDHITELAHRDENRAEEARLLLAHCLVELEEIEEARRVLAPFAEGDAAPARALHLLAMVTRQRPEALAFLRRAREIDDSEELRATYLAILAEHAEAWIDSIDSLEGLESFLARLGAHAKLLRASYSELARRAMLGFIAFEIRSGFEPSAAFAPDWLDSARSHHGFVNLYQAITALSRRRLGEAIRAEWRARDQAGAPLPLGLILALLNRLKQLPEKDLESGDRWGLDGQY